MTHPWFLGAPAPRILAHRGLVLPDSEHVVENTIAAFATAHSAGLSYIESDCRATRDGVAVLTHDETLMRVLGDPRAVAEITYKEFERAFESAGGAATVEAALSTFADVRWNIDIKADDAVIPLSAAVAPHADRVLVTSFDDRRRRATLAEIDRRGATAATSGGSGTILRVMGALAVRSPRLLARAVRGIDALQVPERARGVRIVTPRLLAAAQDLGVEVHVWTVNEPDDMTRLLDLGVNGLVTDFADVALAILDSRRP